MRRSALPLIAAALLCAAASVPAAAGPVQAAAVVIRQPGAADIGRADGVAILRILARPGERIRQAALDSSSGNLAFDAAALRAVRRWRNVPAMTGGSAEPEWLLVRMVYRPAARPIRAASR
ncbi:MAG: TonB family protein [Rhizomicrobium sp.]